MTTIINGSSPSITFSDSTTQTTAVSSVNPVFTGDASINTITVGHGGGNVAHNVVVANTTIPSGATGDYNNAFGWNTLHALTTGASNQAFGNAALYANTTGASNTAIGETALFSNTTASNNTAVGYQAGYSNTTGYLNTFIGNQAGYTNSTGVALTAVGYGTLRLCTANSNTAMGYISLGATTTGASNNGFGQETLAANTTGTMNNALGVAALFLNTTGSNNVAIGQEALRANTTADNNTAVGYQAGYSTTTGGTNVFIGRLAGSNTTTGFSNTYIGNNAQGSAVGNNNEIVIGNSATGKGSGTGYIYPNGGGVYQGNNSSTWSTTSDQRLKKNIVDNNVGLEKLTQIQVRNFEYRLPEEVTDLPQEQAIAKDGLQLGVIAQELAQVLPDCVKTETTGVMSVDTDNLVWYLINAVKELKAEIDQLKGN
jgi:hypothetical protein